MELHRPLHPSAGHFGGEKEQMLNLNRRLESYLSRVKLLDEENAKLVLEIQALRRKHHGDLERRRFLNEELQNARLEVDVMWKERVYAEVDVARLTEELQSLGIQLQMETQAQAEAKAKADQSRRELEEERRAQIWLREKVNQLEHEMKSLIQTHQEEVGHMEALLMQPRVVRPAAVHQGPNLLELGQEYSQRAARAWQEAAQAYQGQLSRLEESVNETRQKLVQANKEKSESVLKLQNLDRELLGLEDLRGHLENTVEQQRESHCRDVQMLQEHLEDLEREKHALALKMDQLLQENRGLAQMKMSLNMEVAAYRALLDSDSLKGDISFQKQPRNIYSKDAVYSPWGVKDNYQISPSPRTTSTSIVRSMTGRTKPQPLTATPTLYQKYVPRKEILEISKQKTEDKKVYQQPEVTPYPKILKNGAIENFRPQEVHEKVTFAEPLSPPDEQEGLKSFKQEKDGDFWNDTVDHPCEEETSSALEVSHQEQPFLHSKAPLEETSQPLVEPALTKESSSFSIKSEFLEMQIQKENVQASQATILKASEEKTCEEPCVELNLSHQIESVPNNEEPISEAKPELEEPFTKNSTVMVQSEMLDTPFENEENVTPQAKIDAWAQMKYDNKTEQQWEEIQVESVPKTEAPFNEFDKEFPGEAFIEDSYTATVKSELKEIPEKPQMPIDTWTEVEKTESVLNNDEASPELVEEQSIHDGSVAVKSEQEKLPSETDETAKLQAPTEAWTEVDYGNTTEKPRTALNLELESVSNNDEANPELVEEPFIDESCSFTVKSEQQKLPSETDESQKPPTPTDAWTEEKQGTETNLSHQVESGPNNEESFSETSPEVVEEPFILESCPIAVKSELQKLPSEVDESEKPQAPTDAWTEEKPRTETNLGHQVESGPNNEELFSETTTELVEEAFLLESCSIAVKSELQKLPSESDESEKPLVPTEAWTEEKPRTETNLNQVESGPNNEEPFSETSPELVGEPFILESCSTAVKSELEKLPSEVDESEKPQALTDAWTEETSRTETKISHQVESGPNNEESFSEPSPEVVEEPFILESCSIAVKSELEKLPSEVDESEKPKAPTEAWTEVEYVNTTEEASTESNLGHHPESVPNNEETNPEFVEEPFIDESSSLAVKSELQKQPSETDEFEKPQTPVDEMEPIEETKDVQKEGESSDSETEAFVEPNFDTKSSSSASEESLKNQLGDIVKEEFIFDSVGVTRDVSPPKEKLYPDGEEMDTWDSVIEQNPDVQEDNAEEPEEATRQHAEPEEDISAKEAQHQQQDVIQNVAMEAKMEPQTECKERNNLMQEDNTDESQDDEQEDSQNVSVSWRTELEGDSYAQDNTLADTRPLIRYKSDDTDANTQASHIEDVDDSSDSEQDKKVGEMVSGTWTEDKTRKFGTMEDLCEEAEGEVLDEEYDLEYLRKDGIDDDEGNTQENDGDSQMEEVKTVIEEDLDTDKLVEQELENLTTEWYTTHFALHQASEKDTSVAESFDEQPKAWTEALKDAAETSDMEDFLTNEDQVEQSCDELTEVPQPDQEKDKELVEVEGYNVDISMVTHCDAAEDITDVRKELVCPPANQELSLDSTSLELKEQENVEEKRKTSIAQNLLTSHESQIVDDSSDDINQSSKPTLTWGVEMRNTTPEEMFVSEEVEDLTENVDCDKNETVTELTHKGLCSDEADRESLTPTDESINASPEHTHEDADLFIVKDSKALLKTNGKANLDDLYSIRGNDDIWMSPLETGASYQPDNVEAKHMHWKLGFGGVEIGESENVLSKSEKEVSQIKSVVKGEIVHSEESDDDSEVMSSDEESKHPNLGLF